ncbi:MAG: YicC family protein [Planctomycetota bacterium]
MTGSGSAAGPTEFGEVRIEVRSLNGRGLQVRARSSPSLAFLEPAVEQAMRARLRRGTVTVAIDRVGPRSAFGDRSEFAALLAELRGLASDLSVPFDIGLRDLIDLAGSVRPQATTPSGDLAPGVTALLTRAIDDLIEHRRSEGAETAAEMRKHLVDLDGLRARAASRAPAVAADYREKLLQRVNEYLAGKGLELAAADVVREVALYSDRVDVGEELQRIAAHAAELGALLDGGGEIGRKCEFLLQELLREINTLGAKSPDVEMSHLVVEMKSLVDKLKEQAANLE